MTDGEEWTRTALAQLRGRRYRPSAWVAFLGASFVRVGETRTAHRRAEREVLVLAVLGFAGSAGVWLVRGATAGAACALWWLLVTGMVELHLGMLERPDGTPLGSLSAPNLLSLVRAATVPLLLFVGPAGVVALLALVGVSDVADGLIARRYALQSRLGQWLDGSVDQVVAVAAAFALVRLGQLPQWVAWLVVVRSAAPWLVISAAYFARAEPPPQGVFVPGRLPGLVAYAGLLLAAADVRAGWVLVVVGMAGGLATFGASVVRGAVARGG